MDPFAQMQQGLGCLHREPCRIWVETPLPFANVQAASTPFQPKKPGDDEIEVVETGSACSEWSLVQRNAEDMRLFGASEPASPSVVPDMEGQDALFRDYGREQ